MESLRDIRQNIKSINSIKQVMLTMKMISSARIKKAQTSMEHARPFAIRMEEMIDDMEQDIMSPDSKLDKELILPFFKTERANPDAIGLVLITADKGLCGAFNALLLRAALAWIKENKNKQMYVFCVGKKGRDFIRRLKIPNLHLVYEAVSIFPKAGYVHADLLGDELMEFYLAHNLSSVDIIYNEFKNLASQKLATMRFFPFNFNSISGKKEKEEPHGEIDFLYEPDLHKIFLLLLPRYVKSVLYRILLESQAAELAARMNAMESASKNAGELAAALGVKMNKVRQSAITNEIIEIVNAADALNA